MLHTLKENSNIYTIEKKEQSKKNIKTHRYITNQICDNEKTISISNTSSNTTTDSTTPIRFTKVLTKYSSEYNNYMFIQDICQKLQMNKSDVIFYFEYLQTEYQDVQSIYDILETYEIGKLYTDRMFRYIQTIHKNCS